MYTKLFALTAALSLIAASANAASDGPTVSSPDRRLSVSIAVDESGTPLYSVSYDGATIIGLSPLGLRTSIGDLSTGMTLVATETGEQQKSYTQDKIKRSHINYRANTLTARYVNPQGQSMAIEWQVSDNNVAFRYVLPRQGDTGSLIVESEATGYRFPAETTTFLSPQSLPMVGWKRTKPSYEEPYKPDAPMSEASLYGCGYTLPALFHVGADGWALLTETGVDGAYCGARLSEYAGDGLYTIAYPMEGENNGNGSACPGMSLPGATPWRTITVGASLAPIAETTITWDLVEPLYEPTAPPQHGRGTWSWILWQDQSINYDDQATYIDFAAEMGYENVLIDNWWDTNIGRDGMKSLADYARSRGVNLIVWYSSSGWWNDIVQSPTNLMSRPIPRKKELRWLRDELGVKAIKVDFFGGDKQETMRLYEDILSDANDFGISVIFHGCTLPRGWERMYPNYVGSEAVLASENLVFSQDFCDNAAFNATLHPFIRNAVGIMEYGGTVLNHRLNKGNDGGTTRRTTDAFELATAILFQNPVQNFALAPNNLTDAPAEAIAFMKAVPTTWDDTRLIDGYPGRYAVVARRHGEAWYVAGVSNLPEPLELSLSLPMLQKGAKATIYATDKPSSRLAASQMTINNPDKLKVTLTAADGFVLVAPAQ